jgi:DNA polymerase-4
VIAHFDIDAFYASAAQLDDPSLRGKPLVVSGSSRRAVVLTTSYEARPFGVRSAMPLYQAKTRCPDLLVVPPNFQRYRELSRAVFAILETGARAVEGLSLDEAFVELESNDLDGAIAYARGVRARVRGEVGLTVSAGVATQKMVAKIASDEAKPDGLRAVAPGDEAAYLAPMPVARLWGIGPKTQARLALERIERIEQIATLSDEAAFRIFGRWGRELRELARGNDQRRVEPERETRSVSTEETFEEDLSDPAALEWIVVQAAHEVAERLAAHGLRGATIGVKLKLADFSAIVRQTTVAEPTRDGALIAAAALRCLERAELGGRAVRLAGVRVARLTEDSLEQLSLL